MINHIFISGDKMSGKKKPIKEGLRNIGKNLIKEKELENNLKTEIAKEISYNRSLKNNSK